MPASQQFDDLPRLLALATGDEKHDAATTSTLDVLWVLYDRVLHIDPHRPDDPARDRFVLSKGHGPASYYAVLAANGFLDIDELRDLAGYDSRLGLHPDRQRLPGVEVSSGSLGHGLPIAVGIALALRDPTHGRAVTAGGVPARRRRVRRGFGVGGGLPTPAGSAWPSSPPSWSTTPPAPGDGRAGSAAASLPRAGTPPASVAVITMR